MWSYFLIKGATFDAEKSTDGTYGVTLFDIRWFLSYSSSISITQFDNNFFLFPFSIYKWCVTFIAVLGLLKHKYLACLLSF